MPVFISVTEFRKRYSISKTSTYELIKTKSIVAKKFGSRTLISVESAEAWAASLPDFK